MIALLLLLLAGPACAEETPSLFLTPAELDMQQKADDSVTRLDAILYYGPQQWKIWINGKPITPAQPDPAFQIVAVDAESASFTQRRGGVSRLLRLAPQQIYVWEKTAPAP